MDGLTARVLKVYSEIGKQLDSIADIVSFGVIPGVIMYKLILYSQATGIIQETLQNPFQVFNDPKSLFQSFFSNEPPVTPIAFIAFLIPVFSAIRLAKFNLNTEQSDFFIGLPTPANAMFIVSLPLIFDYSVLQKDLSIKQLFELASEHTFFVETQFLISVTLISSFLLIVPIRLFALKFKNFSWQDNAVRYIFILLSVVLLIIFKYAGIPLIIVLYIILSIINNLMIKSKTPSQYDQI